MTSMANYMARLVWSTCYRGRPFC